MHRFAKRLGFEIAALGMASLLWWAGMSDDDSVDTHRLYADLASASSCIEADALLPRYRDGVIGGDPQRARECLTRRSQPGNP